MSPGSPFRSSMSFRMLKCICRMLTRPMPAVEELNLIHESDSEGRSRQKAKTALVISIIGWLLIGFSLNAIIFNSFPVKLATSEWQLNLIAALISSSPSLLMGATLISLALVFNPEAQILKDWNLTLARASSWLAVVLVLIIPLQFYQGSRALKNQTNSAYEAINKLKSISKGISGLNSESDLRLFVASLPNSPRLPAKFDAAFPVIKQRAIENIQAQINAATENLERQKSQAIQLFLKEAIRNTAQLILMATAFSALAGLHSRSTNAIARFFQSLLPMGSNRWPR